MMTFPMGIRESNDTVNYLHSRIPIFSNEAGDLNKFLFITSNLILQGLCSNQDIAGTFHVLLDSVRRWNAKLSEEGEGVFFNEENRYGRSYIFPDVLERIQLKTNLGKVTITYPKTKGYRETASSMR